MWTAVLLAHRGQHLCVLFWARSENCEKQLFSFAISARLSVRMEQLGSHWTDFHEI
jgi:hypothetical protein